LAFCAPGAGATPSQASDEGDQRPNVVLILADDLGAGDIGAYHGATRERSKIPTPRMDALASEGMRFDDAHSPSAVCTPTRYGILCGRYAWRTRLRSWVLNGNSRALIEPGRATIASALGEAGYRTACVGKWHLGLGTFDPESPGATPNYSEPIDFGPREVGFDEVFIVPASLDMPPYVFIEGDRVRSPLDAHTEGSTRRWSGGGGFWRAGPMSADFDFYACLPRMTDRAVEFVRNAAEGDAPFFLYMPLTAPHTPWMPTDEFRGVSAAGWYGDFVAQVDHSVGQVLDALEDEGVAGDTIVILASDNGAHWRPADLKTFGHDSHLGRRGMKADIYEAGHRVPLIVRWPGRVAPGSRSDALVGLNDLFATLCEAAGADGDGPDSESFLGVLEGEAGGRDSLVHHSGDGMFAIRAGEWKLIEGLGSGGFTRPRREEEQGVRLYNLARDPGETEDVSEREPDVVGRLLELLDQIRGDS
jgi:arylsulfatase A-like enzyme